MEDNLLRIGRLNKTFGLKGHIRAFIEPEVLVRLKKMDTVFIYSKNVPIPYFPDETELSESGHIMLHFEEVKDKTAADQLVGKELFIDRKFLKKAKPYTSLSDYIGFSLVDETKGSLGKLENMIELPHHELGQFTYREKEILFPWNDEVVLKIDKKKKEIVLRLPEGLIEVYT